MIKPIKHLTLASALLLMTLTASSQTMKHKTIELDEFQIVGISTRTTNQNGQSKNDIDGLHVIYQGDTL